MKDQDLSGYRKNYTQFELTEKTVSLNPMEQFNSWFLEADASGESEANAMSLSTYGLNGYPNTRIVLLKKYTWEGFIFYTNYDSQKGKSIAQNPNVCLSFFWQILERQIIICGKAEKLPTNLSDGYFEKRPRGSQISAWASPQSTVIPKDELMKRHQKYEKQFEAKEVERPPYWGGYIVKPQIIEFWQGRPNRMHDRIRYSLQSDYDWKIERLAP